MNLRALTRTAIREECKHELIVLSTRYTIIDVPTYIISFTDTYIIYGRRFFNERVFRVYNLHAPFYNLFVYVERKIDFFYIFYVRRQKINVNMYMRKHDYMS